MRDSLLAYVTCRTSNEVRVFNTHEASRAGGSGGFDPVDPGHNIRRPICVYCEQRSNSVSVNRTSDNRVAPGYVAVIERATNQVVKRIEVGSVRGGDCSYSLTKES